MYITLPQNTTHYRVEKVGRKAVDVLSGMGAFFGRMKGGRYNGSRQRTVYVSADAFASIAEAAFYEALIWQTKIGQQLVVNQHTLGNLLSRQRLWALQLNHVCRVVDLLDPQAAQTFAFPPYVLWNPSRDDYLPTQDIMNRVFHHAHPPGALLQGVQAPSVRSAPVHTPVQHQAVLPVYRPHQHVFVLLANQQGGLPAQIIDRWNLDIEFVDENGQSRSQTSAEINWLRPRFRILPLRGLPGANTIPRYPICLSSNGVAGRPDYPAMREIVRAGIKKERAGIDIGRVARTNDSRPLERSFKEHALHDGRGWRICSIPER
jgi:RES domain-containing protein